MAQPPPLTSRCSKPSPNACTTVRHPPLISPSAIEESINIILQVNLFPSPSSRRTQPPLLHIQQGDAEALAALITNPEVERQLLVRLRKKAMLYAQDFASDGEPLPNCTSKGKIDVDCVGDLYESYIILLTKEIGARGHFSAIIQEATGVLGLVLP